MATGRDWQPCMAGCSKVKRSESEGEEIVDDADVLIESVR